MIAAFAPLGVLFFQAPPVNAPTAGEPGHLEKAFTRWQAEQVQAERWQLRLGEIEGISQQPSALRGNVTIDHRTGRLDVDLSESMAAAGTGSPGDVWLVDNHDGRHGTLAAEPEDRLLRLGRLRPDGRLSADLGSAFFDHFEIDLVAVTDPDRSPVEGTRIAAAPSLFQRLERSRRGGPSVSALRPAGLTSWGPRPAFATVAKDPAVDLIARGEEVFFEETFAGNGRTCGTCHPAENNYTLDPYFISTLPDDDPLFAAEHIAELAENFEKPKLMRELALILQNPDGRRDLANRYTLRSVPHLLGLSRSIDPGDDCTNKDHALGWGCDGSPGDGSLRLFAVGAVIQHYPKTLRRIAPNDFRLPNDVELDAMAAFLLSLGRSEDPDLSKLTFSSPLVAHGKQLYLKADTACNDCHLNGGANALFSGFNENHDTGVEKLASEPADIVDGDNNPPDGGFGKETTFLCVDSGIGNCEFNTTSLVESADTAPYFHNNAVQTLEGAVDFYATDAFFLASGLKITLDTSEVEAIAAFLRVLNALDNIRSFTQQSAAAIGQGDPQRSRRGLEIALSDVEDAIQVLRERNLHLDAIKKLRETQEAYRQAVDATGTDRRRLVEQGTTAALAARDLMAEGKFWS